MLKYWLYKLSALLFATSLSPAPSPQLTTPATLDEMLTFECAREVASLGTAEKGLGPVYYRDGMAFGATSASDGSELLLINAGAGQFSVKLPSHGVNRIRFQVPAAGLLTPKMYFMSFLAGGSNNSRLFEFSADRLPPGREELDYLLVNPQRTSHLLSHFEYAVYETVDQLAGALAAQRLTARDFSLTNIRSCDHIARRSPGLARFIRFNLEMIATLSRPHKNLTASVGSRLPASLPGKQN